MILLAGYLFASEVIDRLLQLETGRSGSADRTLIFDAIFQVVSGADSELLFPFVARGVTTVQTRYDAMRFDKWLQVVLQVRPQLTPALCNAFSAQFVFFT